METLKFAHRHKGAQRKAARRKVKVKGLGSRNASHMRCELGYFIRNTYRISMWRTYMKKALLEPLHCTVTCE